MFGYISGPAKLSVFHSNGYSAQRVGFFNIGSGRVLDNIPGSGSGSGRVGVSKNMIRCFRVSFFLSGISGYFGYFRVFPGISGIFGYFWVYPYILGFIF